MIECVHAEQCGGCPLIGMDYAQQLTAKRARVVSAIVHYPALELLYTRQVVPGDQIVGYRGRAKLIVSPSGGIGLYSRSGNHDVVDIPSCRVLAPPLAEVASTLRALIASPPPEARALLLPYDPQGGGVLRAIDLREVHMPPESSFTGSASALPGTTPTAQGNRVGVLLTFVLQRDRVVSRDELKEAGRALRAMLPRVIGLAANLHEADAPQILGPETLVLDGIPQAEDRIGPSYHVASFGSFVQVHRGQAARVHALITREIASLDMQLLIDETGTNRRQPRVLDLYGGSGAISIALAHAKNIVTMIESFAPAVQNARAAAEAQGLGRLDARVGDTAEVVASMLSSNEKFDAVVMNPPRRGVSPAAREAIARLGAPLCIYVSCDPDTLARDLDHFSRLGYASSELIPIDMIPLTEEVETVAVLKRAPPVAPRVIYEDDDVIVVEKGPHEPTENQPEYLGSLMQRCLRLPGVSSLKVVNKLDTGTSGLCIFARNEVARQLWSTALATSGRLIYLVAAKGVTPTKGAIARDLREGGRSYMARTRYRRLAVASGHSILRVIPDGHRPHQIRRHLAAIGHPVLGDERYGHVPTNRYFEEKHGLDRCFVHLIRIEIVHPRTGAKLLIESTLPGDLRASLERATGASVIKFLEQKHALGENRASSMLPDAPPSSPAPSGRSSQPQHTPMPPDALQPPSYNPDSISDPMSYASPDSFAQPPSYASPASFAAPPSYQPPGAPTTPPTITVPSDPNPITSVPDFDESPRTHRQAIVSDDD
ncbi:pseudouridine synthase [Polyangium aurulentum]|uniref:pseudouridine synthase n=1 Tax=Polyangium aurulentum TaxID=2567896 RepID=UPI001F3AFA7C|nr:pseudouridine synthase [Polyangium aurulentum]